MNITNIMNKRNLIYVLFISWSVALSSCSGDQNASPEENKSSNKKAATTEPVSTDPMKNKGIGPIKNVDLKDDLQEVYVTRGENIFESKCTACHKFEERYVGPPLKGVTERRTPEWIMNMILNPEEMGKNDPIGNELLAEYMTQMTNQNITEDEARYLLEYFRHYDQNN
ncbi:MAG: c-type cytochrome [Bacteroidia bacterium]